MTQNQIFANFLQQVVGNNYKVTIKKAPYGYRTYEFTLKGYFRFYTNSMEIIQNEVMKKFNGYGYDTWNQETRYKLEPIEGGLSAVVTNRKTYQ